MTNIFLFWTKEISSLHFIRYREKNRIAGISHLGETGETYLFDKHGTLLTDSRFDEQLKKIGLLKPDEQSSLSISIRDPGGNMVQGFIPKIPRDNQPLTYMVMQAIDGKAGTDLKEYRNYRGIPVLGAWLWDEELDKNGS